MNVGPISSQSIHGLPQSPDSSRAGQSTSGQVPFSQVISQFLSEANQQQHSMTQNVNSLVTGETDDIHNVAVSIAKADIAFRLVMEVRDQLISSYQEVMRMQV